MLWRVCSKRLHLDGFLSRSGSSNFRTQIHLHKTIADLLPDGFIWKPFCPELDNSLSNSSTPSQSYGKLHPDGFNLIRFCPDLDQSILEAMYFPSGLPFGRPPGMYLPWVHFRAELSKRRTKLYATC